MKIAVVTVPYINNELHLKFSNETMQSISTNHQIDKIAIINKIRAVKSDNTFLEKFDYTEKNERNNLSMAWNRGIEVAIERGAEYILVPNLDIIFHPECIDNLVKFAEKHKDAILWTANEHSDKETIKDAPMTDNFDEHPHFSCFMVDKRLFGAVGRFDEQFEPAYNEDGDMHYRIQLAGLKALKTDTAKFFHYGSRTIKSDRELEIQNVRTHGMNNVKYVQKWGGMPGNEIFKSAYNK